MAKKRHELSREERLRGARATSEKWRKFRELKAEFEEAMGKKPKPTPPPTSYVRSGLRKSLYPEPTPKPALPPPDTAPPWFMRDHISREHYWSELSQDAKAALRYQEECRKQWERGRRTDGAITITHRVYYT
jgi:hypothetical protein